MGVKCDQCEPYHTNLSSSGCQPCSECEQSLRTNLSSTEDEQNHLSTDLLQLLSLQQANASGLEDVYALIGLLQENVTLSEEYLDTVEARLVVLNSKSSTFRDTITNSAERVRVFLSKISSIVSNGLTIVCISQRNNTTLIDL